MDDSASRRPTPGLAVQASGPVPAPSLGLTEASLAAMVVIWGINFAVVKRALDVFHPLGFNALRYLLASAFVFAVLRAQGQLRLPQRRDLPRIVALGVVGNVVYQMAFIYGLAHTRAGNASLMLAMIPVFILLLGWRREGGGGPRAITGTLLSVVGVALVSGSALQLEGATTLLGDLLMLSAAAVWAVYTVGARELIERYGSLQTTAWTLWVGSIGIFLMGVPAIAAQRWDQVDTAAWGGLLYSALLSIGLAYLLWYRGVERLGGSRTAVYANLTPVVAMTAGAIGLGERLTLPSLLGAALVIGGLMLVRARRRVHR